MYVAAPLWLAKGGPLRNSLQMPFIGLYNQRKFPQQKFSTSVPSTRHIDAPSTRSSNEACCALWHVSGCVRARAKLTAYFGMN